MWARGDGFLRSGDPAAAERYYHRALAIDPNCREALDRLLFAAIELKTQPALDIAIAAGGRYLRTHEDAIEIRIDRAVALLVARRNGTAATEFRWLGRQLHDQRFIKLAAHVEERAEGRRT
ncbi:MAG: tetratricopeptide repeat protein [Vulcanimicrobiaceae bacterium]